MGSLRVMSKVCLIDLRLLCLQGGGGGGEVEQYNTNGRIGRVGVASSRSTGTLPQLLFSFVVIGGMHSKARVQVAILTP